MKTTPLYKQIIQDLLEQILSGELRPGDRIPSEHELSARYHVSSITSKNALTELSDKGYITRIKGKGSFVNTEENLNQIPSFYRTLHSRVVMKAKTIGLVMPSMKTLIDQQLLNALEAEVQKTDYILAITITREDQKLESESILKMKERGVSGLIIFPTEAEIYNEDILKLNLTDFPFILVDRYLKGIRSSCIYTDNYDISKKAVKHLIDSGCKNTDFISPGSHNTVTSDRLSGYKDAFSDNNLPIPADGLCFIDLNIVDAQEKKKVILQYLYDHPHINGLFCVNQEITSYVCSLLTQYHLWQKYKIAAFDYPGDYRVSCIEQDIPLIAENCIKELIASIQYGRKDQHIIVPGRFIPASPVSADT